MDVLMADQQSPHQIGLGWGVAATRRAEPLIHTRPSKRHASSGSSQPLAHASISKSISLFQLLFTRGWMKEGEGLRGRGQLGQTAERAEAWWLRAWLPGGGLRSCQPASSRWQASRCFVADLTSEYVSAVLLKEGSFLHQPLNLDWSCRYEVGMERPELPPSQSWALRGKLWQQWQCGHSPLDLSSIFEHLPHELRDALEEAASLAERVEQIKTKALDESLSRKRDIDILLSGSALHKGQQVINESEWRMWEDSADGVLCMVWNPENNDRLGCYVNSTMATMCGSLSSEQLMDTIQGEKMPMTCPEVDHLCKMVDDLLRCFDSTSVSYGRFGWPGKDPTLVEICDRRIFDERGKNWMSVRYMRRITQTEYNQRMQSEGVGTFGALAVIGEQRSANQLLEDFEQDLSTPLSQWVKKPEKLETLRRLAHQVRMWTEPWRNFVIHTKNNASLRGLLHPMDTSEAI